MASKTYCPYQVYCFNPKPHRAGYYFIVWTRRNKNWVAKVIIANNTTGWYAPASDADATMYKNTKWYDKYNGPRNFEIEKEYILSAK